MRKILIFSLVLCVCIVLFIFLNPFTNKKTVRLSKTEESKALEKVLGRQADISGPQAVGNSRYNGSYLHVSYPENVVLHPTPTQKSETILDSFGYNVGVPSVSVSLQTQKMDATDLATVPGVALRRKDTAKYQESQTILDGATGSLFITINSPYESVAFVFHNGMLYTISAIGVTEHDVRAAFEKARMSFSFSS